MAEWTLYVEGSHAQEAVNELHALDGVQVEVMPPDDNTRDGDWLSLAANIVQVTSIPLLGREIARWYREWRAREPRFSCVIVGPNGERLDLSSATEAEIDAIVQRFGLKDLEKL